MNDIDAGEARSKTPVHLWIVGVLALLWNGMGAFDYLATQLELDFYMSQFTPEQLEYFNSFPKLMTACWAFAIWGAVAGTIGLLLALFPDAWISQFTSDPATQASARTYIYIVGPCFAFHGLGLSLYFASQGANAMVWPVAATALRITVAVGGALILGLNTTLGLAGVYTAAALAMSLYGIIIAASVRLGAWREWRPLT